MPQSRHASVTRRETAAFWLLAGFLILLWVAGGASRPDVPGQVLVRVGAWGLAFALVAMRWRPEWRDLGMPGWLLAAAVLLTALQLIPLPPGIWTHLPGRELLLPGEVLTGQSGLWRPLSISPGWTRNALGSLIVPVVGLALIAGLARQHDVRLLRLLIALVIAGCLLALLQVANRALDHPLINDVLGQVSGNFANRNHMALFAAFGCLIAPVWAVRDRALGGWGYIVAVMLILLFMLVILATGSRAGILLGALGILTGVAAAFGPLRSSVAALPRRTAAVGAVAVVGALVAVMAASLALGKAAGLDRAIALSANEDVRVKILPTVLEMWRSFFPAGSGFGTFDPAFRIFEGNDLLGPQYYNQAHNDLLQAGLDGGIAGSALLAAALAWWALRSISAWRARNALMRRTGSAALLLVIVASAFDYPARTPMIMVVAVIAAAWLARRDSDPLEPLTQERRR